MRFPTGNTSLVYNSLIDQRKVRHFMASTRVSSKYQVVIPKEIRLQVPIATGQVLQVIAKGGVITLVPDRPLEDLKGFLPDLPTEGFRQKDDRL